MTILKRIIEGLRDLVFLGTNFILTSQKIKLM